MTIQISQILFSFFSKKVNENDISSNRRLAASKGFFSFHSTNFVPKKKITTKDGISDSIRLCMDNFKLNYFRTILNELLKKQR
ncbi:hypothetical protein BpHYR1_010731 [Brachionus plicatilis]|uniref:Uncharacterized protein n=1 Tax=Brachionus plicatilis TaxID=10195 RepID=A0A3M7SYJ4_BRAPC|nr:hypothetical protein BpHYR1_010731 [Brachionus plicatilis]